MSPRNLDLVALTFGLLPFALGCETGGVGDPCVPEDEYVATFSGYKESEVNVESRSFQCETRVCLVNHFRGRVSCPYGQTEADTPKFDANGQQTSGLAPSDPKVCRIPGTIGADLFDAITVPVEPQLLQRTAAATPSRSPQGVKVHDSVYCSCRCANAEGGTDDGAQYCECPSGFSCTKLIDDLGFGQAQLAGSYCIREGTGFTKAQEGPEGSCHGNPGECCSSTAAGFNCGNEGKNP